MPDPELTAVILAGGRASRMGGHDKGLLPLHGQPLVAHAVVAVSAYVNEIIISANRNLDTYGAFGLRVVSDLDSGFQGPLAGMLSALRAAHTPYLLTLPCDAPRVGPLYVERMVAARRDHDARACIATCDGGLQPMFALLGVELADALEGHLAEGGRKARDWMASLAPLEVDFSDHPELFDNINTPDDLARLERELEATP